MAAVALSSTPPGSIELASGDLWCEYGAVGTRISVRSGCARLTEPPVWLAETMVSPSHMLRVGDAYTLARSGWVRVHMMADGALCVQPPMPARWRALASRWVRAVQAVCMRRGATGPLHRASGRMDAT